MHIIKSVEGTIVSTVDIIAKNYPFIGREELFQQAYLICVWLYWKRFDESKSKWNTYVRNQLYGWLKHYAKHQAQDSLTHQYLSVDLPCYTNEKEGDETEDVIDPKDLIPSKEGLPDQIYEMKERISNLSHDAQYIASIILSGPQDYVNCIDDNKPITCRELRARIRDQLHEHEGWSWPQIRAAFREVRAEVF